MRRASHKFLVSIIASFFALVLTSSTTISMADERSERPSSRGITSSYQKNETVERKRIEPVEQKRIKPVEQKRIKPVSGQHSDDHSDDHSEVCGGEDSDHNSSSSERIRTNEVDDESESGDCNYETRFFVPKKLLAPNVACSVDASISWAAVNSKGYAVVDFYQIQSSLDSGVTWLPAGTTPLTSFVVTGLNPGSTYVFRVAAHNANGLGAWSNVSLSCTTPSNASLSFQIDGLLNLQPGNQNPTVTYDYADQNGRQGITAVSSDAAGFSVVQGIYKYDLYIGIPAAYNFIYDVTGGSLAETWLVATDVPAAEHPITDLSTVDPTLHASNNWFLFSDSANPITIYAFSFTPGSTLLSILIKPAV